MSSVILPIAWATFAMIATASVVSEVRKLVGVDRLKSLSDADRPLEHATLILFNVAVACFDWYALAWTLSRAGK